MATVSEYRQFANECLRWATEAETEEERNAFLQMARDWTLAALRLEGVPDSATQESDLPLRQVENRRWPNVSTKRS